MNAVVLAGGVRSGLEVPGSGIPRALWPFPADPLIESVLKFLVRSGVERIAICANGKTRMIASELANPEKPWRNLHYSEDPLPRGPAGCLRDLQDWLGEDTFVAIQATAHYDFDLAAMIADHKSTSAAITVGARRCPDDPELLEPTGVYLVEPRTLQFIQPVGFQDFKEQFLPKVIAAGLPVRCHALRGSATLIHSPGHYLSAIREAILNAAENLPPDYQLRSPGVVVHKNATISPTARLTGPCWIENGAIVDDHAVIAGPVILAANVHVQADALVHRTVALHDSTIPRSAEVFSAILPPNSVHQPQSHRTPQPARLASNTGAINRFISLFAPRARAAL